MSKVQKIIENFSINFKSLILLLIILFLTGCATAIPRQPENVCAIFEQHDDWYDAAAAMRKRWNVPIHVPMAMMFQESGFREDAQPPMEYFLGFIPIGRASSAYGYAQAKDETWADYQRQAGSTFASRDDFADAMDFMGWFIHQSSKLNKVAKSDAYRQYLNYHEGWGGYRRGSYHKKAWLKTVALKVKQRSDRYQLQLNRCENDLKSGFWDWF
jgi:hypothetical protein